MKRTNKEVNTMKRTIAFLLIIASLCSLALTVSADELMLGDINKDGLTDNLDAAIILKHDALIMPLFGNKLALGDVNGDGETDSLDAATILRHDAGMGELDTELPANGEGVSLGIEGWAQSQAGYIEPYDIWATALVGGMHRLDSVADLELFKAKYDHNGEFAYGEGAIPSFNSVTEGCDEAFFEEYSLLLLYISCAGSEKFQMKDVIWYEDSKTLQLCYGHVDYSDMVTDDMNGRFLTVPVLKSAIEDCRLYDISYGRPTFVYTPDEEWNCFIKKEVDFDGTEKGIAEALVKVGGLPEGSVMNSFETDGGEIAYVDMNEAFAEGVSESTFTEYFYVGCLVNTLLDIYNGWNIKKIILTVNGETLVTDHVGAWTEPVGFFSNLDESRNYAFTHKADHQEIATEEEKEAAMTLMSEFLTAVFTGDSETYNSLVSDTYAEMAEAYRADKNSTPKQPIYFIAPEGFTNSWDWYDIPNMYVYGYYPDQDAAIAEGDEKHIVYMYYAYFLDTVPSEYVFDIVYDEIGNCKVNNFGMNYGN